MSDLCESQSVLGQECCLLVLSFCSTLC